MSTVFLFEFPRWDFDGTITHSKSLWSRSVFEALKSVMPQIDDSFSPEYGPICNLFFRGTLPMTTTAAARTTRGGISWKSILPRVT